MRGSFLRAIEPAPCADRTSIEAGQLGEPCRAGREGFAASLRDANVDLVRCPRISSAAADFIRGYSRLFPPGRPQLLPHFSGDIAFFGNENRSCKCAGGWDEARTASTPKRL